MNLYENELYMEDLDLVANSDLPWDKLQNKIVMISGATGLIGSFLVDVLMRKNDKEGLNCKIYALSRQAERFIKRFSIWKYNSNLYHIPYDINNPLIKDDLGTVDYILHLASNTHPIQYSTDPIGTITTNIIGVHNMLNFAVEHSASRFLLASSNEIYGENRGDKEAFSEDYCGYIDCNTMRAGYPESKRCSEALCQAFKVQKGLNVVISRLTRSYGPTMLFSDTKAISQFIKKALSGEDIVLKSSGTQYYSYTYVSDAASGLLYVLLKGENGEAYNVADESSDIMLKDLSSLIANIVKKKVVFDIPDSLEQAGYSKATKARLDGTKLKMLGWNARYDIKNGIERTISILRGIN